MKRIARVLVTDGRGRFLAILQRDKKRRVAFPGGHLEPGETPVEAAARELAEETGLVALEMKELGRVVGDGREVYLFAATAAGTPRRSQEGAILWTRPESFVQGKYGEFSEHAFRLWERAFGVANAR